MHKGLIRAKYKLKKNFNKKVKAEIYGYYMYFLQKKLNRELIKQKLANNNISESDMINIRQLAALPVKTLRQIAKLRNISQNLSKSDTIYALICSEPIINEQKYIFDSNNEIPSKINKIRQQLFDVSPYINKKNMVILEKDCILLKKYKKLIES